MKTKTYYVLKRNSPEIISDIRRELSDSSIKKSLKDNDPFILIEKHCNIEDRSEKTHNAITIPEQDTYKALIIAKDCVLWDYTGAFIIIHYNDKAYTYSNWRARK